MAEKGKSFVKGAAVLGVAGIIIKALGAVFRIPLGNLIGADGMAYYQSAYPVYVLFLMIATSGIPTAISRMVSERIAIGREDEAHRVFKISFALLLAIGLISFSICFFGAGFITNMLVMPGAKPALMAIAPALLFCPLMAAFRGYFQGQQDMTPTAVSQVTEQFFRVVLGLVLAFSFIKVGKEIAAAGAAFGATAGGIAGLATVAIIYALRRKKIHASVKESVGGEVEASGEILKKIFLIAVPITIGAAIMPIMNFIDVSIVMRRLLASGWDEDTAHVLYGQLSGYVGSLINFPQVLTQSIAMSLVPAIAASYKRNEGERVREDVALGLRLAMLVGFPCAAGLMVMARPIMILFYPLQRESALGAASCLQVMAFGVIFLSMVQTLTGVLQAVGKQMVPVRNLAIGALAKIVVTYTLTGIHAINVKGAAIGTITAYVIASTLNLLAVRKYTGVKVDLGLTYAKPLISSLVMSLACYGAYRLSNAALSAATSSAALANAGSCLVAVALAVLVYGFMVLKTHAVLPDELKKVPKINKFIKNSSKKA